MNKESDIYRIYKKELDLIEKHINNKYFYKFILNWGTIYKKKFYKLHSQINIYECIFLHYMVSSFNKKSIKNINILEIGCAYGTSGMIIINAMDKFSFDQKISYTAIDPNQKTDWKGIGIFNINNVTNNRLVEKRFIFNFSSDAMKVLLEEKRRYNIIFIDGSHSYNDVLEDIKYSDKLLKIKGIVILDDVLHDQVAKAVKHFYQDNKSYKQIQISGDEKKIIRIKSISQFKSWSNPKSMHAYQKIL